ncbi:MAG TPA: class I SAM-dependent methyltransferase [Rhizomicrobium sp.]|jgi:SAM-dependent methyltransferase|nr:class I SAM-dependent methyltransferase [Rhizomicrobium sp.]
MSGPSNAQQVEYWNGPVGERWARLQEKIDLHLEGITEAALPFATAQEGERILDVGCGCGTTTFLLAFRVGRDGSAAGIDISVPMLNVARARARAQNANVVFREGDASSYDFQPVFDLVFSRFGIMFFADPVVAFANIRRAVAPGGRLVFVCWRSMAENLWASVPMQAALHLLPPQEPADPLAPGPFAFADGARVRAILASARYSHVEIERFDGMMNMGATLEDAAAEVLNIGPLARAATDLDEDARAQIRKTIERAYAPYAGPIGVTPPAACWFVRARL